MIKDYTLSDIERFFRTTGLSVFANSNVVGVSFSLTNRIFIPADCTTTLTIDNQKPLSFTLKQNTIMLRRTEVELPSQNAIECYINLLNFAIQMGHTVNSLAHLPIQYGNMGSATDMLIYTDLTFFSPNARKHAREVNGGYINATLNIELIIIAIYVLLLIVSDSAVIHIDE